MEPTENFTQSLTLRLMSTLANLHNLAKSPYYGYESASKGSLVADSQQRNFSPIAILGLSCSLMVTWEGLFSVFVFGLQNGGPAGLIYGFLFVWTGYTCVVATMGELVSMWPTAGGQYHWVHVLAPEGWKDILSYLTGWQSVIAWQAVTASGCYLMATAVQGLAINSQSTYKPERWHGTLLAIAVILVCLLFNSFLSKGLPLVETATLALHVSLFLVILVVITVMSPTKSSHSEVWATFLNEGGYESKGLSFFVGLITPVFAFTGVDGAVHMSEEVRNSSRVVPWAMMGSILINGITGFSMLIAILYCMGDVDTALSTPTGYPFIEIFSYATRSSAGGTAVSALIVTMFALCTVSTLASASRQLWAFARDNAVPNANLISYVHPRMKVPIVSIGVTTMVSCVLSLINIGSTTAFNAIVSLTVSGFFGSYLLPFSLLLYARIKKPQDLPPSRFRLGRWGVLVNGYAIVWSMLVLFFSFWPQNIPVTTLNMNWSVLLWGAVNIFAVVFWCVHGRRVYKGPVVETHVETMLMGDVVAKHE